MAHIDHLPGSYFGPPTIVDLIRHRASHQPNDLAFGYLVDGDEDMIHMTNADLDRKARAIGAWLQMNGMTGERAMLLFPPGLDFIAAYFGCLYAGTIAVPVYPPRKNRSANRVQIVAEDCNAKVALTNTEVLSRNEKQLKETPFLSSLLWCNTNEIEPGIEKKWIMPDIHGETVAFLQYTSGSTGNPKGVVITHTNLLHNSATISTAFENTRSGSGVFWLPTYHDMGLIGGILQPLYVGRPNILMSPMAFLQRPFRWLSAISRYQATVSGGPNFAYELCVKKIKPEQVKQLDLSSWKVAFNGAEPVRSETLQAFAEKFAPAGFNPSAFYPCYGLAEATLLVAGGLAPFQPTEKTFDSDLMRKGWAVEVPSGAPKARRIVGNGGVLPDQAVAIVNPDTKQLALNGEVGEIWIYGPSVAQGYWQKKDATEYSFHAYIQPHGDEKIEVPGPYFRTGDLGFVWDGELYVSGRLKDMIIWHGVNLYPQDIELSVQNAHELCREDSGAVFAVEKDGKEQLVVVQEVDKKLNADYREVVEAIKRNVSKEHELPLDVIYLIRHGAIPKTSSGKIQRNASRLEFLAGNFEPVMAWNAETGEFLDEEQFAVRKEAEAKLNADSKAQVKEKMAAADHDAEEIRAEIPDLDKRPYALLLPNTGEVRIVPLAERLAARALAQAAAAAKAHAFDSDQAPMIGAHVTDENALPQGVLDDLNALEDESDDEEDATSALGGDGAGFDPALEALSDAVKTLNTEGLPDDLRRPEIVRRMLKIIVREVKRVARERAVGMTVESAITELGMDSLERMEILNVLEETFGGRFPEMVLQDLITARDVAEAICKYFGQSDRLRQVLTYQRSMPQASVGVSASEKTEEKEIPEEAYIFEKTPEYLQLKHQIDAQLATGMRNPYFTTHEARAADTTIIGGKEYIHFSSYNYLGLGSDQRVVDFVKEAVEKYGCSCSASRLVSGQKTIHVEFEKEIAEFNGTEDAIVFSAGHHVNESVLGHVAGKGDLILHDSLAHNSMVMGSLLSGAQRRPFEHSNWKQLDEVLTRCRGDYRRVWIAIEGVYSMDGDIAPLPEFIALKKKHKAFLYVDEAHSLGTLGPKGAGIADYYGIDPAEGDLWMGTISKSLASCGGFISGRKPMIEYLRYTTPGFVFSAAISPAATAAALGALRVLKREPERVERLQANSALFLKLAKEAGLDTGLSVGTPIIPIIYGNSQLCMFVAQQLFDRGINVQPIIHPAVEEKAARLRFFMTAIHTEEQIRYTVKTIIEETEKAKKILGI